MFGNKKNMRDTLFLHQGKDRYLLKENFIYPESVEILSDQNNYMPDSINYSRGLLYWKNNFNDSLKVVVKYNCLVVDLPFKVGPFFSELPNLDSFVNKTEYKQDSQKLFVRDNIFTSGSINRQINLSTNGMSEFTGGLNLSLSGMLDNNIMLSAVLSDKELMIQPEGNTRNLEDFDQVFISLNNSNFYLNAGDIVYKKNIDDLINLERNVIGLNGEFNFKNYKTSAVIASTKGQYIKSNIDGIDGVQGPYSLTSDSKNKDVVLIAGSEKVWFNGERLVRGASFDYIIDYTKAEIIFTAKNLVQLDSDILVEYEYVNDNYPKSILGATYNTNLSKFLNIITGIHREVDNTSSISNESDLYQKMVNESAGNILLDGALQDSLGSYYINNGVYIYDPNFNENDSERFNVVFTYDGSGNYEKLVSPLGEVYFRYIDDLEKNNLKEYYSPNQKIPTPKSRNLYFTKFLYNIGENLSIESVFSRSMNNENIFSNNNKSLAGNVFEFDVSLDSIEFKSLKYGFSFNELIRQKDYKSPSLDREVQFTRIWDIDTLIESGEYKRSLGFYLNFKNKSISDVKISKLKLHQINKNKLNFSHEILSGLFSGSFFKYKELLTQKEKYNYKDIKVTIGSKNTTPFIIYKSEKRSKLSDFDLVKGGIDYKKGKRSMLLSIENRNDRYKHSFQNDSALTSNDFLSSLQYQDQKRIGWRKNITVKKRLKKNENIGDLNYLLGSVKLSFNKPSNPFVYEINTKTEKTQNETFSLVYDSVGVGLGSHRFDKVFNTYVKDQNGPYISYSIPTGSRIIMNNIKGYQNISYDARKIKSSNFFKLNINSNFKYSGSKINLRNIFKPNIDDTKTFMSYFYNRIEIDKGFKNYKNRLRIYNTFSIDFQGYDPRGNDLFSNMEIGLDGKSNISERLNLKFDSYYHEKNVKSGFIPERYRNTIGSWYTFFMTFNNPKVESEISIKYGKERGNHYLNSFSVSGVGLSYSGRIYIKNSGSIMTDINFSRNKEYSGLTIIPPEALNGQTLGKNISSNILLNYFIKKDVSLSMSVNYIDNTRYEKMITFMGEFRAYL